MQSNESSGQLIKNQFSAKRRRQLIATVLFAAVLVVFGTVDEARGVAIGGLPSIVAYLMLVIVSIAVGLFTIWNWRCPGCDRYLYKSIWARLCPKCGVALQ